MAKRETGITVVRVGYSGNSLNIPLPSTNTVYTDSVDISDSLLWANVGMASILNGVLSSANVIITCEEGWRKPTIEGSADPVFVAVQTQSITAVNTWNYTALLSGSVNAIVPYIRFKVVSATTNTSSTVNINIMKQVSG